MTNLRSTSWIVLVLCQSISAAGPGSATVPPYADPAGGDLDGLFASITVADISGYPEVVLFTTLRDAIGDTIEVCGLESFSLLEYHTAEDDTLDVTDLEVTLLPTLPGTTISVVLVMDVSGSLGTDGIEQSKAAAREFVDFLQPEDRAAIVIFETDVKLVQPLTNDHDLLHAAIDTLYSDGWTSLYDGALLALDEASREVGNRNTILFSDGEENHSDATFSDMIDEADRLLIPIHTIAVGDADEDELREIAMKTNATFRRGELGQLGYLYTELTQQIRSQYRLVFTAPHASADHLRRELQLHVWCGGFDTFANVAYEARTPLTVQPALQTRQLFDAGGPVASGEALTITFKVTGDPTDVRLLYRQTGTSAFVEVTMAAQSQNAYMVTIPGEQVVGPGIDIYAIATNAEGVSRSFPAAALEPAIRGPQVVVEGSIKPEVDVQPTDLAENTPFELLATVTDAGAAVEQVLGFYRMAGQREYRVKPMARIGGDKYMTEIPGEFVQAEGVEFVVIATNSLGLRGTYGQLYAPSTFVPPTPVPEAIPVLGFCGPITAVGFMGTVVLSFFMINPKRWWCRVRRHVRRSPVSSSLLYPFLLPGVAVLWTGCAVLPTVGSLPAGAEFLKLVTVNSDGHVSIELMSEEFDPHLELLNNDRQLITSDDDGRTSDTAQINSFLKAGTYMIRGRNNSSSSEGLYVLFLGGDASLSDPAPDPREESRAGALFFNTEDLWSFSLLQSSRVEIRVTGQDSDVSAEVLDDRFQEVIKQQDGDMIVLEGTLEAGAYFIRCSASGTDSGRYQFSVFAADVGRINLAETPSLRDRS